MKTVLTITHLSHHFGSQPALRDLSLELGEGEVLALLGPNGAGKTTTVRLANGLYPLQTGQISVLGLNPHTQGSQVRRKTGVLTETPALYERLTAFENLDFFGTLAGMALAERSARIRELLTFFELEQRAAERVGTYSKGMKQRLALGRALLHHPSLLFLDEPTSGLDPEAAQQVHDLIAAIRKRNGQSVLICTHHLLEAERLCDRFAIIQRGCLLALGTLDELRSRVLPDRRVSIELLGGDAARYLPGLNGLAGVLTAGSPRPGVIEMDVQKEADIPDLVAYLAGQGAPVFAVTPQRASLEEIYFKLQEQAREEDQL